MYSWPGVEFLLKGSPPWMLAGDPRWMISRSVAQIATASMRTRTSARPGIGVGFSRRNSSSGPPSTQAFIWSGTGSSGDALPPAGLYMLHFLNFGAFPYGLLLIFPAAAAIGICGIRRIQALRQWL